MSVPRSNLTLSRLDHSYAASYDPNVFDPFGDSDLALAIDQWMVTSTTHSTSPDRERPCSTCLADVAIEGELTCASCASRV